MEARELEIERRTRALNLNAVRDAETKSAAPSVRSSMTHTSQEQARIKQSVLVLKPHLKDPLALKIDSPQGSRSPAR